MLLLVLQVTPANGGEYTLRFKQFKVCGILSASVQAETAREMMEKLKDCISDPADEEEEDDTSLIPTRQPACEESNTRTLLSDGANYIETHSVSFHQLTPAREAFKVRDLDYAYVDELVGKLISSGPRLSSLITVVKLDANSYEVIDGNHRLEAMDRIRKFHHPDWFDKVYIIEYEKMDIPTAIKLACSRNYESKKSKEMTDYEVVTSLRKMKTNNQSLDDIYDIFRATSVSNCLFLSFLRYSAS